MVPVKEVSPFDALWAVYPLKLEIAKARLAYTRLAADETLHTLLVDKASALATDYQTKSTEKKWQKRLHKWIEEERYLEELPPAYESPKLASPKRDNLRPATSQVHDYSHGTGLSPKAPVGQHCAVIEGCEIDGQAYDARNDLSVGFRIVGGEYDGQAFSHKIALLSPDQEEQFSGQTKFRELRQAIGMGDNVEVLEDLHGKTLTATIGRAGEVGYSSA